eukprot:GGOE01021976.1.p2 GENE.GGOE01021976.1~~GGOE01021976.1.p2  ORF type:complete len:179 (+),score=3.28 GGOE01021976.1:530-1066(+)
MTVGLIRISRALCASTAPPPLVGVLAFSIYAALGPSSLGSTHPHVHMHSCPPHLSALFSAVLCCGLWVVLCSAVVSCAVLFCVLCVQPFCIYKCCTALRLPPNCNAGTDLQCAAASRETSMHLSLACSSKSQFPILPPRPVLSRFPRWHRVLTSTHFCNLPQCADMCILACLCVYACV